MSVEYVNSVDHKFRAMIGENLKLDVKKGVKSLSFLNQPSNNNMSTTSTQYDFTLNQNQILCDYMLERATFNVQMTLQNTTGAPIMAFQPGNLAPRVLPLTNASQSISIRLNSQSITVVPEDIITPLLSFNKPNSYIGRDLPCAGTIDTTADFASGVVDFASAVGSLKNPLLDYFSSTSGFNPRFSDVEVIQLDNTDVAAKVGTTNGQAILNFQFTTHEPIFTGINSLSLDQMSGFTGLTSVSVNRNFVTNLVERLINFIPTTGLQLTNTVVTLANTPVLYYALYTPESDYITQFPQYYPMLNYYLSRTPNVGSVVASASPQTFTFNSGNISLSQIPRCIYVWCAIPNSQKHSDQSDAPGMAITNINLNFAGQSGQFSSVTTRQELYQHFMASQGSIIQYHESGYINYINNPAGSTGVWGAVGSIGGFGTCLRIDATQLGGIDWNNYSVGSPFNTQLTINCQANLMSKSAANQGTPQVPYLFVLVVNEKSLKIDGPTSATLVDGLLDGQTIANIRASAEYEYQDLPMIGGGRDMNRHKRKVGAGAWDKIKNIGKFAWNNKDNILKVGKAAMPLLGVFGGKKKSSKRRMYGGSVEESDSEDEYCGGAIVSKMELQRRLK